MMNHVKNKFDKITIIVLYLNLNICLWISRNQCFASDVLGCNGFVKSNIGDIDFSKVEVRMFTKQGTIKDHTECAPNNGYYFLPLYDKGEYVLKVAPPLGWHFEPEEVIIYVDGSTDQCSLGIDINFVLQGFAVTGQVTSLGDSVGPKGVLIDLLTTSSPPKVLLSTTTQEGGSFILTPVKPGQYIVQASHDRWHLAKKRTSVTVKNGNTELAPGSLVVSGYDVSGQVTSDNEPITGVSFVLFQKASEKRITAIGCDSSALTGFSPTSLDVKELIPVCHVSSDAKGRFTFASLPPGEYTLVPHYKGTHSTKFDVQPQHLSFQIKHGSLELPTKFQVKGFSVEGRVLWSVKGKPFKGASVTLDKKVVSKTQNDGTFHLDNMTPGIYKLLVQAENVMFEEQSVKVTPNTPHIDDLVPSMYRVCGRVSTNKPGTSSADRLVDFVHEEDGHVYQTTSDSAGEFCLFLPPATYSVTTPTSEAERESGLQFAPLKRSVKVVDSPVRGVDFSQLQATVRGTIECLISPCLEITVSLHSQETATVISKGGKYTFENVLPGEYTISVTSQDYCWESEQFMLSVSSVEVMGPKFVQIGLPIHFVSSHSTTVHYRRDVNNSAVEKAELPAGSSTVCVTQPGDYIIEPVGCHGYATPKLHWTLSSEIISLTAISHLYTGKVISSEQVSDLVINVIPYEENTASANTVRRLGPLSAVKEEGGVHYSFSIQLTPGEAVTLVPAASSLLFTPTSEVVTGDTDCVAGVAFKAERGLVIKGRVLGNNLPVSGASVSVHSSQGQLIASQVTDAEGRYIFGPLSTSSEYNVTAEKEGYVLTGPNIKGEFNAHKLAEVIVTVRDKASGLPLQGVLLSLSGGENYRRNSQTGSDGTLTFLSLSPSDYYLRPMMKEYRFDPPSKMITVQEGATFNIVLSGERVAYSVLGIVTSLSGDPEPGVVVEALGLGSEQCRQLQEESSTETNGHFRIRGLQPQCEYSVKVKQGAQINQHIQRSTPEGIQVKVDKEDVFGLAMIVFRRISRTDISVYITADSAEHLRSLVVNLFRDETKVHSAPLSSLKVTPSFALTSTALVFPPVPADGHTYSIQLESSLSQKTHNYRTHPVFFKANSSFQLVRLNFLTTSQASENDISHTSYLTLPLMLMVLLAVYNRDVVKTLVTRVMEGKLSVQDNSQDDSSGESLSIEPVKKKVKQRKA